MREGLLLWWIMTLVFSLYIQQQAQRRTMMTMKYRGIIASAMTSFVSSSSSSHDDNDNNNDDGASNSDKVTTTCNYYRVFLGIGSNLGDRYQNIRRGLELLCDGVGVGDVNNSNNRNNHNNNNKEKDDDKNDHDSSALVQLIQTSFLYQTAPMYRTNQPAFLNGVIEIQTKLEPLDLLQRIKHVEKQLGRNLSQNVQRNTPRPLDLDILLYEERVVMNNKTRITTTTDDDDDDMNKNNQHFNGDKQDNKKEKEIQQSYDNMKYKYKPLLVNQEILQVPHPRMEERDFVLTPLLDMISCDSVHPVRNVTYGQLYQQLQLCRFRDNHHDHTTTTTTSTTTTSTTNRALQSMRPLHESSSSTSNSPQPLIARVLPLPRNRVLFLTYEATGDDDNDKTATGTTYSSSSTTATTTSTTSTTILMGILNVTPDSFSDGGKWDQSIQEAVNHALQMEQDGATIIDIGGESTRPGAIEISVNEQLRRIIPVIQAIRQVSDVAISIDTRNAQVAEAAIQAGADMVNDVSGGCHDPAMLRTVAQLGVPLILMHMRGTPQTMQSMTNYNKEDEDKNKRNNEEERTTATTTASRTMVVSAVVEQVSHVLRERVNAAQQMGIHRWQLIVDPGIGFAKDLFGNLSLLQHLSYLRSSVNHLPLLLGTSRKGFIGKLSGVQVAQDRDYGTVASLIVPLSMERGMKLATTTTTTTTTGLGQEGQDKYHALKTCTILRVHNVAAAHQATKVMEAIWNV